MVRSMAEPTTLPSYYQFTPRPINDREWWQQIAANPRAANFFTVLDEQPITSETSATGMSW